MKKYKSIYNINSNNFSCSPIFITGYPRSGTSLLYRMIAHAVASGNHTAVKHVPVDHAFETAFGFFAHPEVSASAIAAQPWPHIKNFIAKDIIHQLDQNIRMGSLKRRWEQLLSHMIFQDAHIPRRSMELNDLHTREPMPYARQFQLRHLATRFSMRRKQMQLFAQGLTQANSGARLTDKFPFHLLKAPELFAAFPDCRFVHITRDPVHIFASLLRRLEIEMKNGAPAGVYSWMSLPASAFVRDWNRLGRCAIEVKKHLGPQFVHITYADLTHNTAAHLHRLEQALDITFKINPDAKEQPDQERRFRFASDTPQPNPSTNTELCDPDDIALIKVGTAETFKQLNDLQ